MADVYRVLLAPPATRAFFLTGALGRLPMAMLGIGTILLVSSATGSFAVAGAVSATMLLSQSVTAPRIGRFTDRFGQRRVLLPLIALHSVGLIAIVASVLLDAPRPVLFAAGVVAGATFPPVGSLVRARWSATLAGTDRLAAAFSLEAAVDEVVYVVGPLLVAALVWMTAPAAGLLATVVVTVVGGLAFAAQRGTEPPVATGRPRSGSVLRVGGLRLLVASCVGLGTIIGVTEVSLVAFAAEEGRRLFGGPLVALFSVGSVVAGLLYGSRTWRAPLHRRLLVAVAALVLGTVPTALASGLVQMTVAVFLAGFVFSPAIVVVYELVEALLPGEALGEGFGWLQTALGAGLGVGAFVGGLTVESASARGALLVAVAAGAATAVLVAAGQGRLQVRPAVGVPAQPGPAAPTGTLPLTRVRELS